MLDYWRKVCYTLLIEQITKTAEKGGFLLNNRDQFKKILNYLSALVIICAFMKCFDTVWNNFYNKAMRDPFWHNGNILMVAIYAVLYISMAKTFNGFRLGYDKFTGLFGSQVLGVLCEFYRIYTRFSYRTRQAQRSAYTCYDGNSGGHSLCVELCFHLDISGGIPSTANDNRLWKQER